MSSGLRYSLHGDQNPLLTNSLQYFANIIGLRAYKNPNFCIIFIYMYLTIFITKST
jgi:hypothetical protein